MKKTETIAEYLARGGVIHKFPSVQPTLKVEGMKPTAGGPAIIMSMEDANLYYGQAKTNKPRKKSSSADITIDVHALPEALRKKYVDGVISEANEEEEDEEESF